jgi:hypothetical protein
VGWFERLQKKTRNTTIARAARGVRDAVEDVADRAALGGAVRVISRADAGIVTSTRKQVDLLSGVVTQGVALAPRIASAVLTGGATEMGTLARVAGSYSPAAGAVVAAATGGQDMNLGGLVQSAAGMFQSYFAGQPITSGQINSAIVAAGGVRKPSAQARPTGAVARTKASKSDLEPGRMAAGAAPSKPGNDSLQVSPMMLAIAALVLVVILQK